MQQSTDSDPDNDDPELSEYKNLQNRRDNLRRTAAVLDVHDVVVQKLITKARDDLVSEMALAPNSPKSSFRTCVSFLCFDL